MGKQIDDLKGRLEEAAGDITDDKGLKRKGKIDKMSGKAKKNLDKTVSLDEKDKMKARDTIDRVKDAAKDLVD